MPDLGSFRARLTVERGVRTTDGAGGQVWTYTPLPGTIAAEELPAGGIEGLDPHAQRSHRTTRVRIYRGRLPRDLQLTDRITGADGRRFEIVQIDPDTGGSLAWLELTLAEMTQTVP